MAWDMAVEMDPELHPVCSAQQLPPACRPEPTIDKNQGRQDRRGKGRGALKEGRLLVLKL